MISCHLLIFRQCSPILGRGAGVKTGGGGGANKGLPLHKAGAEKVLVMLRGGGGTNNFELVLTQGHNNGGGGRKGYTLSKGVVTNYGEGGATKREGGAREVLPLRKGGAEKVFAILKGGAQKVLG